MSVHKQSKHYDVIVVGGGMSGVCAALAAARHGAKTAIIQNRSMFGGNASSEIRMHIVGANCHASKENLSEGGILMEILLANKARNQSRTFGMGYCPLGEDSLSGKSGHVSEYQYGSCHNRG